MNVQIKTASLTPIQLDVVLNKGTEKPFSGDYDRFEVSGTYLCRQCGLALYRSDTKFHSGCGWPSFDEELPNAVKREMDADGRRTEILCNRCDAHLGHIFLGEQMTAKDTRHCVNSLSLDFVADKSVIDTREAVFAAGCFWGVESLFKKLNGVLRTEVGYSGGHTENPTYEDVCRGDTGHVEAIRVLYNPDELNYELVCKYFFEIHDPSQVDGQGPDRGDQYLSVAFYYDDGQREVIEKLIAVLKQKEIDVTTKVLPVKPFWPAELYHQDYYRKTGKVPYCHRYERKF